MATFNGLLETLLNISKLDAGIIKPEYTSINVDDLINWLEHNFAGLAAEKKLGFKLHFPAREQLAMSQRRRPGQVGLMNLVSNAIKFTSQGGILISARRRGSDVLFQVWDTGMGMTRRITSAKSIDEFYQINNPQRDRTSGLGLGLAIAKRALALIECGHQLPLAARTRDRICVSAAFPGNSTGRSIPTRPPPRPRGNTPDDDTFAQGKRFVVLEDDAIVAQAMVSVLQENRRRRCTASRTRKMPCAMPDIEHADYFIADYMLGGKLNGIQFLNQLRRKLDRPINAVLMTGDTSPSLYVELSDFAWTALHKPIDFPALISSLKAQEA